MVTTSQYFPGIWGFPPTSRSRPSRVILGVTWGCLLGVAIVAVAVIVVASQKGSNLDPRTDWCALDVVYAISYVKLLITVIKYTPQVMTNIKNRSTKGWSIVQILLDITGGVLSITQQGIDSWLQRDWSGITGNPVKFALGNVSIIYDVIFISQHYVVYTGEGGEEEGEDEPLLREQAEGEVGSV
jgi:cystinosin